MVMVQAYENPLVIHYEAPQVAHTTRGAGVEILVHGNIKKLVVHTEHGDPVILGRLERCDFNPEKDTDGTRRYYFS